MTTTSKIVPVTLATHTWPSTLANGDELKFYIPAISNTSGSDASGIMAQIRLTTKPYDQTSTSNLVASYKPGGNGVVKAGSTDPGTTLVVSEKLLASGTYYATLVLAEQDLITGSYVREDSLSYGQVTVVNPGFVSTTSSTTLVPIEFDSHASTLIVNGVNDFRVTVPGVYNGSQYSLFGVHAQLWLSTTSQAAGGTKVDYTSIGTSAIYNGVNTTILSANSETAGGQTLSFATSGNLASGAYYATLILAEYSSSTGTYTWQDSILEGKVTIVAAGKSAAHIIEQGSGGNGGENGSDSGSDGGSDVGNDSGNSSNPADSLYSANPQGTTTNTTLPSTNTTTSSPSSTPVTPVTTGLVNSGFGSTTPAGSPVYRFFDDRTGTQFLTASNSESTSLQGTRPDLVYEGVGLGSLATGAADPNGSPIYRFFDTVFGTHFYTSNLAEEKQIVATRPDLTYEGISFYEYTSAQAHTAPVYRFFESTNGTHFYTASTTEQMNIQQTRPDLVAEGIAFYSPTT